MRRRQHYTCRHHDLAGGPRALSGIRVSVGTWLLVAPSALLAKFFHEPLDRPVLALTRLLGARHLAQAAVMARHHTHKWILAGAAVDASHAATMAILAGLRPERRALALTDAACATMLAGSGIYAARHAAPRSSLRCATDEPPPSGDPRQQRRFGTCPGKMIQPAGPCAGA